MPAPLKHLRSLKATEENLNAFSITLSRSYDKTQRVNVVFTVTEMPVDFLATWIRQDKRPVLIPPANEAIVVNRLLNSESTFSRQTRELLADKLLAYANFPGFSRVVFLAHSTSERPLVAKAISSSVIDESISDVEFAIAVAPHKEYIRHRYSDLMKVDDKTAVRRWKLVRTRILKED